MSKHQKTVDKMCRAPTPRDVRWDELVGMLGHFGFDLESGSGSRRRFVHRATTQLISLHEPHPQPVLKAYQVRLVVEALRKSGFI